MIQGRAQIAHEQTVHPGVVITVGVCALLAVVLLLIRSRTSDSDPSPQPSSGSNARASEWQHARAPSRTDGGWIAESDQPDMGEPAGARTGRSAPAGAGRGAGELATGGPRGRGDGAIDARGRVVPEGHAATVVRAPGRTAAAAAQPMDGAGSAADSADGGASAADSIAAVASASGPTGARGLLPAEPAPGARTAAPSVPSAPGQARPPAIGEQPGQARDGETDLTTPIDQGVMLFDSAKDKPFPADSRLQIADAKNVVAGEAGTVSFWLEPQWEQADQTNGTLVQLNDATAKDNHFEIFKVGQSLQLSFADSTGSASDISSTIDSWQPGERHMVTAAWGQGQVFFYVDGKLAGQQPYTGQFNVQPGTPLDIGSAFPDTAPLPGQLSDFRIYKKTLGSEEVANQAQSPPATGQRTN